MLHTHWVLNGLSRYRCTWRIRILNSGWLGWSWCSVGRCYRVLWNCWSRWRRIVLWSCWRAWIRILYRRSWLIRLLLWSRRIFRSTIISWILLWIGILNALKRVGLLEIGWCMGWGFRKDTEKELTPYIGVIG